MDEHATQHAQRKPRDRDASASPSGTRTPWREPKLRFLEPKLTKQGDLKKITAQGGFFGTFFP